MVAPAAGDVALVPFPFSDLSQSKVRPAICLADQRMEKSRLTPKQSIYHWLIHHGFVEMRVRESHAAFGSWWWLVRHRRRFCGYGVALANLLHRLHETVLEPGFTETDLSFLNHAVPRFFQEVGATADTSLVAMLVQLHDAVPAQQRPGLIWHPDESQRRLAAERLA